MAVRDHDGTGDYVDLEPLDITARPFTIVAVIKRDANGTWDAIATWQTSADAMRITMALKDSGQLSVGIHNGTTAVGADSGAGTGTAWTVLVADGWCIVALSKPASSSWGRLSKFTPSGGWVHIIPTLTTSHVPGTIGAGKVRVGRFESTDDANGRKAALAVWAAAELSQANVEALDGGDAVAWDAIAGGYTDLWEPGHNADGSAITAWSDLNASIKGLLDATAVAGNGTVVTGDDPAGTIYTVGTRAGGSTDAEVTAPPMDALGSIPTTGMILSVEAITGPLGALGNFPDPAVSGTAAGDVSPPPRSRPVTFPSRRSSPTQPPQAPYWTR